MKPEEKFANSRPRVGQRVTYKGQPHGIVRRVEGGLCWVTYDDDSDPMPFIWCFKDCLNNLHDWPTKRS